MTDKFKDVPVESGTKIIFSTEAKVDQYDVVYQKWHWDGIYAESIIFHNDDIAQLTESQVRLEVAGCTALVKNPARMTYKKGEKYTFVNFNFVTE